MSSETQPFNVGDIIVVTYANYKSKVHGADVTFVGKIKTIEVTAEGTELVFKGINGTMGMAFEEHCRHATENEKVRYFKSVLECGE